MIARIIAWLIELFRSKPVQQKELETRVKKLKQKVKDIDNENNSPDDNVKHLNK